MTSTITTAGRTGLYWHAREDDVRLLARVGLMLMLASALTLLPLALDPRQFQGVSVWLKPWKFQLSVGLYLWTLAWALAQVPQWLGAATRRYVVLASLVGGLFEVLYITWQGSQGLASHYNESTPLYQVMYAAMGMFAVLLNSSAGVLGWAILRRGQQHSMGEVLRLGLGLGLILTFVLGTATGGYLGSRIDTGHWVGGTRSDALGWWVLGWSRDGGDLRVAHFLGVHAMQLLPLLALALPRCWPAAAPSTQRYVMLLAAALLTLGTVATFVQAVLGQPLL